MSEPLGGRREQERTAPLAVPAAAGDGRGATQPLEPARAADPSPTAAPPRTGPPRAGAERVPRSPAAPPTGAPRQRRARLRLRRVDPWSVFSLALLISLFLAVVLVVAVVAVYAVLEAAGVPSSLNDLVAEVTRTPGDAGEPAPLFTAGRALTAAGVVAVLNVVLLTALATLAAVLYNLCASFTGGIEVTLGEDDR